MRSPWQVLIVGAIVVVSGLAMPATTEAESKTPIQPTGHSVTDITYVGMIPVANEAGALGAPAAVKAYVYTTTDGLPASLDDLSVGLEQMAEGEANSSNPLDDSFGLAANCKPQLWTNNYRYWHGWVYYGPDDWDFVVDWGMPRSKCEYVVIINTPLYLAMIAKNKWPPSSSFIATLRDGHVRARTVVGFSDFYYLGRFFPSSELAKQVTWAWRDY